MTMTRNVPGKILSAPLMFFFTRLGRLSGEREFSLATPNLPSAGRPTISEFGWGLLVGVAGALLCRLIRLCAQSIRPLVERFVIPATIAVALVVAALAMLYAEVSGNPVAIGIGAMTVSMLRLPMTSVPVDQPIPGQRRDPGDADGDRRGGGRGRCCRRLIERSGVRLHRSPALARSAGLAQG